VPPGGTVSVRAGLDPDAVWIEVGDTGPGIAPHDRARILEPLYRGQGDRRFPPGLGLGIARDRIVAPGGRLDVVGALGESSRFTPCIPRDPRCSGPRMDRAPQLWYTGTRGAYQVWSR
jgi:signal transduction histidine kinase